MFALPPNITPCLERYATWLGRNTLNPAALAASSSSARWYSCFSIWKLLIGKRIERDLGEQLSIQEVLSSPSAPGWTCGSRVFPFWYWWILCDFFGQIPCNYSDITLIQDADIFRQVLLVHTLRICMKPGPMIHPLFMLPGMLTSGSATATLKKSLLGIMMLFQRRSLSGATILGQHHTPQWDCPCLSWRRSAWCGRWST